MKIPRFFLFLLSLPVAFCLHACQGSRSAKNVAITGAFDLYPIAVKWADIYKKAHPDHGDPWPFRLWKNHFAEKPQSSD